MLQLRDLISPSFEAQIDLAPVAKNFGKVVLTVLKNNLLC